MKKFLLPALALVPIAYVVAGPLTPPAGPIAPTYKTLSEVEPRTILNSTNTPGDADSRLRISSAGSYYLASVVSATTGLAAIEIDADHVVLDLNGFWVRGANATDTIRVVAGRQNVTIRNGSVAAGGGAGINAADASRVLIENVTVTGHTGNGIVVGNFARVMSCAVSTSAIGFVTGENSILSHCTADNNTSHGFDAAQGSTIVACTAANNAGRGIFHRGRGSVTESHAINNGQEGIRTENTGTVENCTSSINGGRGIFCSLNSNIRGCSTWQNGSDGIVAGNHSVIANCNSTNNTGVGIQAGTASTILDNIVSSNTSHGISISGAAYVARNNCTGNGFSTGNGAGIRSTGSNSRIEDNNCTSNNPLGIEVTGAGNIIVRNSCRGNTTNYSLSASSSAGTIINVAGSAITSTNSFANFSY